MLERPVPGEYPQNYQKYISLVPQGGNVLSILEENLNAMQDLLGNIPESKGDFCYAPGKWSMKEVLGHITDTERIMSYRLLRISRGDDTPLVGFDEEQYVKAAKFNQRSLKSLLSEFAAVRKATAELVGNIPAEAWSHKGQANQTAITARSLAYIIAGHEMHHRNIVLNRYLNQ